MAPGSFGFTSTIGLQGGFGFTSPPNRNLLRPKPISRGLGFTQFGPPEASVSPNLGPLERPRFHPIWGLSRDPIWASRGLGFTQFGAPRKASVSPNLGFERQGLEKLRFHPIWGSPKSFGFTQFGASREARFHPIWASRGFGFTPIWG